MLFLFQATVFKVSLQVADGMVVALLPSVLSYGDLGNQVWTTLKLQLIKLIHTEQSKQSKKLKSFSQG